MQTGGRGGRNADSGQGEDLRWEREVETLLANRLWPALQNQSETATGTQGVVPFWGSCGSAEAAIERSPLWATTWEIPSSCLFVGKKGNVVSRGKGDVLLEIPRNRDS